MSRPLSEARDDVAAALNSAAGLLIALDFDGTLVPLASTPDEVYLPEVARHKLQRLTAIDQCSVAIVSGRERHDLQSRVGVNDIYYAGNHGLEISGRGAFYVDTAATEYLDQLSRLSAALKLKLQDTPGALVEDKALTASVHYRNVPVIERDNVRRIVHAQLANSDHPFVLTSGHMVYDIRPRTNWHKGSAIQWIQQQSTPPRQLVIFIGDDSTDEEAFVTLTEQITVHVGDRSDTAARYHVAGPTDVQELLDWLIDRLS